MKREYAIPLFYYSMTKKQVNIRRLQLIVYPQGNMLKFVRRVLQPEQLTLGYVFHIAGVLNTRPDIVLSLLFYIYKDKKPAWYLTQATPKRVYTKLMSKLKHSQQANIKYKELIHPAYFKRNIALRYYVERRMIPAREIAAYMGFKTTKSMATKFMWPSKMTLIQIARLATLADEPISAVLNRLLSVSGNKSTPMYMRPSVIDNTYIVRRFEEGDYTKKAATRYKHYNAKDGQYDRFFKSTGMASVDDFIAFLENTV